MINTLALSANTQYGAYLVFKMIDLRVFLWTYHLVSKVAITTLKLRRLQDRVVGLPRPNIKSDGWLEIEMGELFTSGLEHEEVHMSVIETKALKGNFFFEGIEIRPKEDVVDAVTVAVVANAAIAVAATRNAAVAT
nr:F-box protein PP2-B1 [Trifolium pratense]